MMTALKRLTSLLLFMVVWSVIIFHSMSMMMKCNESKTKFTSQPFEDGAPSSSTKYETIISSSIVSKNHHTFNGIQHNQTYQQIGLLNDLDFVKI